MNPNAKAVAKSLSLPVDFVDSVLSTADESTINEIVNLAKEGKVHNLLQVDSDDDVTGNEPVVLTRNLIYVGVKITPARGNNGTAFRLAFEDERGSAIEIVSAPQLSSNVKLDSDDRVDFSQTGKPVYKGISFEQGRAYAISYALCVAGKTTYTVDGVTSFHASTFNGFRSMIAGGDTMLANIEQLKLSHQLSVMSPLEKAVFLATKLTSAGNQNVDKAFFESLLSASKEQ